MTADPAAAAVPDRAAPTEGPCIIRHDWPGAAVSGGARPAAPTEEAGEGPSTVPTTCICDYSPDSEGPEQDCPVHGDVRLYAHWLAAARAERDALRDTVARIEALVEDPMLTVTAIGRRQLRAALAPPSPGDADTRSGT